MQPELFAEVDRAHSAGPFAEQVPARLAAQLELSAEVVRAQSAQAQVQPELLGLAQQVQPEAQAQPEEAQQADKAGPGLRHCWLRAEQALVLRSSGRRGLSACRSCTPHLLLLLSSRRHRCWGCRQRGSKSLPGLAVAD